QDIRYAISFLDQYIPALPFMQKMKAKRPVFTLEQFEDQVKEIDHEALLHRVSYMEETLQKLNEQLKERIKEEHFFRQWQNLDFLPNDTETYKHFTVLVGTLETEKVSSFETAVAELEFV